MIQQFLTIPLLEDQDGAPLPEDIQLAHASAVIEAVGEERNRIAQAIDLMCVDDGHTSAGVCARCDDLARAIRGGDDRG